MTYTREELLSICESAFVPEAEWRDRDSASAQRQLGEAYALLKAGCRFEILHSTERHGLNTDENTIWVEITFRGFQSFEWGDDATESEHFYLPTQSRLEECRSQGWSDWY